MKHTFLVPLNGLILTLLAASGCSGASEFTSTDELSQALSSGVAVEREITVGKRGYHLLAVSKRPEIDRTATLDVTPEELPRVMHDAVAGPASAEALADALRPVVVFPSGHTYIGDPDLVEARRLFAGYRPEADEARAATPLDIAITLDQNPKGIFGTDDRWQADAVNNPAYRPQFQFSFRQPDGTQSGCSGTLIGPQTGITAAHCAHSLNAGPDNVFLRGQVASTNGSGTIFWCVSNITYPHGWLSGDFQWDMAVVDFRGCTFKPAATFGYIPWISNAFTGAPSYHTTGAIAGYPGQVCPGPATFYPTLCAGRGELETTCRLDTTRCKYIQSKDIDVTAGQSGSGWIADNAFNGGWGVIGVTSAVVTVNCDDPIQNLFGLCEPDRIRGTPFNDNLTQFLIDNSEF